MNAGVRSTSLLTVLSAMLAVTVLSGCRISSGSEDAEGQSSTVSPASETAAAESPAAVPGEAPVTAPPGGHVIIYEATGEGTADISYTLPDDSQKDEAGVKLPWKKTIVTEPDAVTYLLFNASNSDIRKKTTCRITMDGKELDSQEDSMAGMALCGAAASSDDE